MNLLVTGGTGFIGRHTVAALLRQGHLVTVVSRDPANASNLKWFNQVEFITCDLQRDFSPALDGLSRIDAVIHLAWPGVENYSSKSHLEQYLPADLRFLNTLISAGLKHLLVSGTCLEYGMQSGPLSEEIETQPTTKYGLAKDTLRKELQLAQQQKNFTLQWVRLFYTFGEGQNPNSILSQLDRAIDEEKPEFKMSFGEQLRDYLPAEEIAENIAKLLISPHCNGIINCCSGKPISVRRLVESHCQKRKANIHLNLGFYSYQKYEPLAFWGIPSKLSSL
jgi:nucleoside-diphosphate-sugar epimerase